MSGLTLALAAGHASAFVLGGLITLMVTAARCEAEADRRFVAGLAAGRLEVGSGRYRDVPDDEDGELPWGRETARQLDSADVAVARVRRLGRLRAWAHLATRNDRRRERVGRLREGGAGL